MATNTNKVNDSRSGAEFLCQMLTSATGVRTADKDVYRTVHDMHVTCMCLYRKPCSIPAMKLVKTCKTATPQQVSSIQIEDLQES